jgi:hypothetical protein
LSSGLPHAGDLHDGTQLPVASPESPNSTSRARTRTRGHPPRRATSRDGAWSRSIARRKPAHARTRTHVHARPLPRSGRSDDAPGPATRAAVPDPDASALKEPSGHKRWQPLAGSRHR